MNIMLDLRKLGNSGAKTYALNLLENLLKLNDNIFYYILLDKTSSINLNENSKKCKILYGPSKPLLYWLFWNTAVLPKIIRQRDVKIYHSVKHVISLRNKCKNVITFHSARLFLFPHHYGFIEFLYWKFFQPLCAKKYNKIIAVSHMEKRLYSKYLKKTSGKYHVTYLSSGSEFRLIEDEIVKEKIRYKYNLPKKFILSVGRIHPIKNLESTIKVFSILKRIYQIPHKLVIVGSYSKHYYKIHNLAKRLKLEKEVIFTGPIQKELPVVYNIASMFMMLSWYDAFSQVCLEAMACGLPVVCSNTGGLPEVVGNAAICHAPDECFAIAKSSAKILTNEDLNKIMRKKSLSCSKAYTWEATAKNTANLYQMM